MSLLRALSLVYRLSMLMTLAACATHGAPPVPDALNVADAAIAGGDPAMALQVAQAALTADPADEDALYHEGAAYYALGRCMDSMAAYRLALQQDPGSAAAEIGLGRCLLKRNPAAAEQAFQAAIRDDPGSAAAFNDLGIARDLQGHHAAAIGPYQRALLLQPGSVATEVNLGLALALAGHSPDALQYLGPLAAGPQTTPRIREDFATALITAGRVAQARQVLAVDLPPDQANAFVNAFMTPAAAPGLHPAPKPVLKPPPAIAGATPVDAPTPIPALPAAAPPPPASTNPTTVEIWRR
jgi:Flp pilus assembly protein TadD